MSDNTASNIPRVEVCLPAVCLQVGWYWPQFTFQATRTGISLSSTHTNVQRVGKCCSWCFVDGHWIYLIVRWRHGKGDWECWNPWRSHIPISVVFRSPLVTIYLCLLMLWHLIWARRFIQPNICRGIYKAYIKMHRFNIMLGERSEKGWHSSQSILCRCYTRSNTLQNLFLDFTTLKDLKVVEWPGVYIIAPHGFRSIKATIKAFFLKILFQHHVCQKQWTVSKENVVI